MSKTWNLGMARTRPHRTILKLLVQGLDTGNPDKQWPAADAPLVYMVCSPGYDTRRLVMFSDRQKEG